MGLSSRAGEDQEGGELAQLMRSLNGGEDTSSTVLYEKGDKVMDSLFTRCHETPKVSGRCECIGDGPAAQLACIFPIVYILCKSIYIVHLLGDGHKVTEKMSVALGVR